MPVITPEVVAFLEGPNSVMVASHDVDLVPDIARAVALRCAPDGDHVTVALPNGSARGVLAQLAVDGRIAIVAEFISTHRTMQVKGRVIGLRPTPESERPEIERAVLAFFDACEQVGIPRRLTERMVRWPVTSVDVRVEQLFEQSPGPGAGEPLSPLSQGRTP